ncbi:MAG: DUF4258 domain-containing protein [Chitinophagaceae bacterium]|nr:MAG: DUF4258 domain-containing protein [Chitinophagaceae bacterium]
MKSKYFPFVVLLAAALFFYWIKNNQRGKGREQQRIEINTATGDGTDFNRNASEIIYSKHARCRMDCRQIDESEVKEILQSGQVNENKIENSSKGISIPLEGTTHDNQKVRIVFAPKEDGKIVVVTVIDLEKEYECDCK